MLELRDRVLFRFRRADALANPSTLLTDLRKHLDRFAEPEQHLPKLQALLSEANKLRARDPKMAPFSEEGKPVWDELKSYSNLRTDLSILVDYRFYDWFSRGSWTLALAILQQYTLPPANRRRVEQISKFWATKQKRKKHRNNTRTIEDSLSTTVAVYQTQLDTLREQQAALLEALSKGKPIGEDDKIKVGPFSLVNTGGFNEDVMEEVAEVVKKATALLNAKGLGRVCYGDILITKKISKGNVLAFYMINNDELFIRAGIRINVDNVRNVLHELGHRLQLKFLSGKDRDIKRLYDKCDGRGIDRSALPAIGDEVPYKGDILVVKAIDFLGRKVKLKVKGDTGPTGFSVPFEGYQSLKGDEPNRSGFVTAYAKASPEENFAEMVSFYCLGKLSPEQTADLEAILE